MVKKKENPMYTHHGQKKLQGNPVFVNGQRALAYIKDEELLGYTTLEELSSLFYRSELPEYTVSF